MSPPDSAEVPPSCAAFSTTSTVSPASAARTAASNPPAPEPTTIRSASLLAEEADMSDERVGIGEPQHYGAVRARIGIGVVGDMSARLVDVAEKALDRMALVQPRAGTGARQLGHLAGANPGHARRLRALQQAIFDFHSRARLGVVDDRFVVAQQYQSQFVGDHHRLAHRKLGIDVFRRLAAMLAHMCAGAFAKVCDRAVQGADAGRRNGALEYLDERNAVQPAGIDGAAGAALVAVVVGALGAVLGHERVVDHHVVAAGGAQAQHIPVPDDLEVRFGQQEGAMLQCARAVLLRQQAAEEDPLSVFAAAGKAPVAGEAITALDRLGLAHRHVGGGDAGGRILAPYFLLGLFREQWQRSEE